MGADTDRTPQRVGGNRARQRDRTVPPNGNRRIYGIRLEFWLRLTRRVDPPGAARPLFYALRYTEELLGTEIPARVQTTVATAAPPWPFKPLMDHLVVQALTLEHPNHPETLTAPAHWLLYLRSHYLRMPPGLLIPHLLRKTFRKRSHPV
jgi:hypothetical protein